VTLAAADVARQPAKAPALRVALDLSPAIVSAGGVRAYALATWRHLRERQDVELAAFGAGRGAAPEAAMRRLPVPLRVLHFSWRTLGVPRAEAITGDVDVVHSIDLQPPPTRRPLVMTIHDVMAITHPDLFPPHARRYQQDQLRAARQAAAVVTSCTATAAQVVEVGELDPRRVLVTPFGPGLESAAGADQPPGPEAGSAAPYILAVGVIEPRKAYDLLAIAMSRVRDAPTVLVAGPDGWRGASIRERVTELDSGGRIRFLGGVADETLARLYRGAALVCQPSLAEGFGFPVLEAMTFGVPVVASDTPSAREIGSGALRLVTPGDADALAGGLAEVLTDLDRRRRMVEAGLAAARAWTWARCTDRLVDVYRLAAGLSSA
jgi:glycosyltransferase involved in cell wall biosynthesis